MKKYCWICLFNVLIAMSLNLFGENCLKSTIKKIKISGEYKDKTIKDITLLCKQYQIDIKLEKTISKETREKKIKCETELLPCDIFFDIICEQLGLLWEIRGDYVLLIQNPNQKESRAVKNLELGKILKQKLEIAFDIEEGENIQSFISLDLRLNRKLPVYLSGIAQKSECRTSSSLGIYAKSISLEDYLGILCQLSDSPLFIEIRKKGIFLHIK